MKKNQLAVCVIIVLTVLALGSFRDLSGSSIVGNTRISFNDEKKQRQMNYKIMLVIAAGALGYFAYTKIEE